MGQKVHPKGLRLGISTTHNTRWFAEKNYASILQEDIFIRSFVKDKLQNASVSKIEIERRTQSNIKVIIHTAKPGVVIGRSGAGIDKLKDELKSKIENKYPNLSKTSKREIDLSVQEIPSPETDAQVIAENIASQIVRRVSHRKAMKQAITRALRSGVKGIKIIASGRLRGAEIARNERYIVGKVPLHTLRAEIDYGFAEALTTYGQIGIRVWIYKGDATR